MNDFDVRIERGRVCVNAHGKPITTEVGCGQTVVIDKMFGPLIFTCLRVTADFHSGEFVIERQRIDSMEWLEVARIPGQLEEEYDEQHPNHRESPLD
jgi:hypothetical protein